MGRASSRQLAVIMFTDMVRFTALAQRRESVALELIRRQQRLVRKTLNGFGGREVKTLGDGFLIHFGSALRAVECALAIQQSVSSLNETVPPEEVFLLRIGLHIGDVERPKRDVLGDCVNVAARIQSVAPPGGVALSGLAYEQVRNQVQAPFEFRGRVELKHVQRPIALFAIGAEEIERLPRVQAQAAAQLHWPRRTLGGPLAVAAAAGLGLAVAFGGATVPRPAGLPSVAVLPFSNLSDESGNGHFVDGMHDALLTRLASLGGMKVISRTSVMGYRDTTSAMREIGEALGAEHVVEGSVQRIGDRIRVNAQLIEARSDRHLWARVYDRSVSDVFGIQGELAQGIAREIQAALAPGEQERLFEAPTQDAMAYDLYLRAVALEREDRFSKGSLARIQNLLEQAIGRDPRFALAHAALARTHVYQFDAGHDGSSQRLAAARSAGEVSLRLEPSLAEGHLAMGLYHYYGFLDFDRALGSFGRVLALRANSSEAFAYRGFVLRRAGRLTEAVASLERARELDPRNPYLIYELAATHAFQHDDAKAVRTCEGMPWSAPQAGDFRTQCMLFSVRQAGSLEPARALERDLARVDGVGPDLNWLRFELAINEGRYAAAEAHLHALSDDDLESWAGAPPREMLLGDLARLQGDSAAAGNYYRDAVDRVTRRLDTLRETRALATSRAFARALLARLLAHLGDAEGALDAARTASDLLPPTYDRFYGPSLAEELAKVHLALGQHERSLDLLEGLLERPSHTHINDLRLQRQWGELWEHPRFLQLVNERT